MKKLLIIVMLLLLVFVSCFHMKSDTLFVSSVEINGFSGEGLGGYKYIIIVKDRDGKYICFFTNEKFVPGDKIKLTIEDAE